MKKVFSIAVVLLAINVLCFSSNVPRTNNHGFSQEVGSSSKMTIIEKQSSSGQVTEQKEAKKVFAKPVVKHNQKTEIVTKRVVSQPEIPSQDLKIAKKEAKKEIKRSQADGELASLLSDLFATIGILFCWHPLICFCFSIPAIILGIVGLCKGGGKEKLHAILGLIGGVLAIILTMILIVIAVAAL